MRKSQLDRIREWRRKAGDPIIIGQDGEDPAVGLMKHMVGGELLPTQQAFNLDPSLYKAYMGAAGVAKTSTICVGALSRALWQPGSKGLVARYDYNDLMDTTAGRMQEMLHRLPEGTLIDRDKSPPMKWFINPIGGGEPSQITFMGLKDNKGSYEFNWGIIDEADECDERAVKLVTSRLRAPGGNYSLAIAFNPPDKNHWLYTACTGRDGQERVLKDKPAWLKVYRPQPGENNKNLPKDYWENLRKSLNVADVQRLVDGEWGVIFAGEPVFREFSYNLHTVENLAERFEPSRPLLRFWDFGYNHPYCCWAQLDWEGRLLVFREVFGHAIEATAFARQCKGVTSQYFPNAQEVLDYGDPAVRQKKDTGQTLAHLMREGIRVKWRISSIDEGIQLMRQRFQLLIDGEPAVMLDKRGCQTLITALRGGYCMDRKGEKPLKDGVYDHPIDALRYGMINTLTNGTTRKRNLVPDSIEYDSNYDVAQEMTDDV